MAFDGFDFESCKTGGNIGKSGPPAFANSKM